jgi:hypothetical protein
MGFIWHWTRPKTPQLTMFKLPISTTDTEYPSYFTPLAATIYDHLKPHYTITHGLYYATNSPRFNIYNKNTVQNIILIIHHYHVDIIPNSDDNITLDAHDPEFYNKLTKLIQQLLFDYPYYFNPLAATVYDHLEHNYWIIHDPIPSDSYLTTSTQKLNNSDPNDHIATRFTIHDKENLLGTRRATITIQQNELKFSHYPHITEPIYFHANDPELYNKLTELLQ